MRLSDEEDYEWFFRSEYPRVLRTSFLILGDEEAARDVAQEAFVQLFRKWDKVSRYEVPEAWVRRVSIRMSVRALRRRRFNEHALSRIALPEPTRPWPDTDLMQAVSALPPAQRAAIVLFYFEDQPVSEIAQLMECSPSTVKVHLHKARKRLNKALVQEVGVDATR
ncbi:MAG: SigE family RNA polymerase sigma factor [Actinomycetota bacterium]|nr:SigE family RNA polymerase sigma factor [Actinomycetota bacterium]